MTETKSNKIQLQNKTGVLMRIIKGQYRTMARIFEKLDDLEEKSTKIESILKEPQKIKHHGKREIQSKS